ITPKKIDEIFEIRICLEGILFDSIIKNKTEIDRIYQNLILTKYLIETKNLQNTIDLAGQNMVIFVTVPDDSASKITEIDMSGGVIAIIGNEGNGISQELINAIPNRVTIPMRGNAESLNASAAAIITMWEMMR
ncbi:MAG: TrmH family RNA methyltransferase, partial [Oscillospiraceae bacterium]